jgi:hypothetical protein
MDPNLGKVGAKPWRKIRAYGCGTWLSVGGTEGYQILFVPLLYSRVWCAHYPLGQPICFLLVDVTGLTELKRGLDRSIAHETLHGLVAEGLLKI